MSYWTITHLYTPNWKQFHGQIGTLENISKIDIFILRQADSADFTAF